MKYIILSPKQSGTDTPMFWRSNDQGYTSCPFAAGIYTQEQIDSRPDYYNNGFSSIAVPLTDSAMRIFNIQVDWTAAEQFLQKK